MTTDILHIGTYSETIHTIALDRTTGALSETSTVASGRNPSFLAYHPTRPLLYAVNELRDVDEQSGGAACSFALDPTTGNLQPLNTEPTHGADPCHLAVDPAGRHLVIANYTSGHVSLLPITADGRLAPASLVIAHKGGSVDPARQTSPHPHQIVFDATGERFFVADLGLDRILAYRWNSETGTIEPENIPAAALPGSGPRQIALSPTTRRAYVLNELTATVSVYAYDPTTGMLGLGDESPMLPSDFTTPKSGAELQLAPSGRFLYASNRGHDSIAAFAIEPDGGGLKLIGHSPTGGRTPRNFALSPDGTMLIAANQDSDSLATFHVDIETGALTPTGHSIAIGSPVCVRFMPRR